MVWCDSLIADRIVRSRKDLFRVFSVLSKIIFKDFILLQTIVHYSFHFLVPGLIAWFFFRSTWKKAWLLMIVTMLVDLDHLLAVPIFVADRCSINFHLLHTYPAMIGYGVLFCFRKTRIIAIGLLLHMATDAQDCLWIR